MIADKQLTRMIEKGKPLSVIRKKVEALALAEDRVAFDVAIRDEYNELFPRYRDMTIKERNAYYDANFTDIVVEVKDYPPIAIDYSEDESYVTFTDWSNETRVVQEAIYTFVEGSEESVIDTPEVVEQVRPYIASDVTDIVDAYVNGLYKELRAKEYPSIADYVDAVVKDDTEAIEAYKEACLAVKAKYPKL